MTLILSTELLFSKLQQEKATGELAPLQVDFYSQATEFVNQLDGRDNDENKKQQENSKRMLASLKERRKQKLLMYVAYNRPLPPIVPEEEERLYNEIRQMLNKEEQRVKISKFKINSDIPEVLTSQGRKIGPFKQGEVVEVSNNNDAEFIAKNKIGETVA
jgi:DNA replication initiation complex subunit (GINS family)